MQAEKFTKLKVRNILKQARPKGRKPLKGLGIMIFMSICLIGTTLSIQTASLLFSIAFMFLLTYSLSNKRLQWSITRTATITALVAMSTLSGCGPILSNPPKEIITFCNDKIGNCTTGVSTSWVICGVQLNDISIEAAKANGELKDVFGVNHAEGFGLVAVKQITVFGG